MTEGTPDSGEHLSIDQSSPESPEGQKPAYESRRAFARLAGVVVLVVALAAVTNFLAGLAVIVGLIVIVMVHEFGHFLAAKATGMKVTEYFVGFGPRLWSFRKGETEYGVKAIPLGGYVRIIGMHKLEEVPEDDDHRTFREQPFMARLFVVSAGIASHFVMVFFAWWVLFSGVGVERGDEPTNQVSELTQFVTGESPAQEAGIKVGDRIVSVNGTKVDDAEEVGEPILKSVGKPLELGIVRDGRRLELTVTPIDRAKAFATDEETAKRLKGKGFIGIGFAASVEKRTFTAGFGRAAELTYRSTKDVTLNMAELLSPAGLSEYFKTVTEEKDKQEGLVDESEGENRFSSPVGIVKIGNAAVESGVRDLLLFFITINLSLGIFNLIPLLPFDGGHIAIAVYERIRSRHGRRHYAAVQKLAPVAAAVIAFFGFIFITSLYLDITRGVGNPFE